VKIVRIALPMAPDASPGRRSPPRRHGHQGTVFFLFSSRLGCLGSLLVSAALTLVLLFVFDVL
jgi:hypothetical protein